MPYSVRPQRVDWVGYFLLLAMYKFNKMKYLYYACQFLEFNILFN